MAAKKDSEKFSNDNGDTNSRTRISGSKLARRARSFKDDFFDKISSIRSPGSMSNGSRSNSPKSKNRHRSKSPKRLGSTADSYDSGFDNPLRDLESQMKQVQFALRYFQDVISKNKLEMLPGNGTIVLDTIANIHSVLKSYALDEQSSLIVSGLNQVYQSVARLIKLCDDLLIMGEKALNREYVMETVHSVEDAVQNLVTVAGDKISERENRSIQSESSTSSRCSTVSSDPSHYRVSLPEITMSPNERQLLEQTTLMVLERHLPSRIHGQEITETPPPPPKPPLLNRTVDESPPPLPPKKRNANSNVTNIISSVPATLSLERLSVKSDNSSVTSFDSSSGGYVNRSDLFVEDSTPVRMARERISSSSSSGFVSLRDSSHCFTEQQRQGCSFFTTSSTVDGIAVTTSHNESHYATTSRVMSHFTNFSAGDEVPPALPVKTRKFTQELMTLQREGSLNNHMRADAMLSNGHNDSGSPPPLPLKKKHIMAYMEMFGNCSPSNNPEMFRRSIDSYNILQAEWQKHEMLLTSAHSCSFDVFCSSQSNNNLLNESSSPPPALPPRRSQLNSIASSQSPTSTLTPTSPVLLSQPQITFEDAPRSPVKTSPVNKEFINNMYQDNNMVEINAPDPLAETDVSQWLVLKRPEEDGPDIRGGHPDALIVLATKASKNEESDADFLYQEAFLTTYRTFITPVQLLEKLVDRYHRFDTPSDAIRQRAARETFSLLVRVVGDLTITDMEDHVVSMLMEFVYQLLCSGALIMGKALRIKLIEKYLAKLHYLSMKSLLDVSLSKRNIYTRQSTLLDFKSEHIAEQMTLLDAELFTNIEIPEVLIWTQEQNEDKSPNLTRFTEHFNKMSYWARSRILEQNDAKDRERYVMKFIKIMKHLRKMNNFNSYLALLSALDSAPIRRLEWQKHITDGLKEYCALIDSSSSFRAYRQALAETQPPCIPYIGLVLQDLTFVHIGNNDYLSDSTIINFSKRWQQFNIVENMKRFKKVTYNFKGHERIVAFFSNFEEYLCEEAMWQISESIKPRGGKKTNSK